MVTTLRTFVTAIAFTLFSPVFAEAQDLTCESLFRTTEPTPLEREKMDFFAYLEAKQKADEPFYAVKTEIRRQLMDSSKLAYEILIQTTDRKAESFFDLFLSHSGNLVLEEAKPGEIQPDIEIASFHFPELLNRKIKDVRLVSFTRHDNPSPIGPEDKLAFVVLFKDRIEIRHLKTGDLLAVSPVPKSEAVDLLHVDIVPRAVGPWEHHFHFAHYRTTMRRRPVRVFLNAYSALKETSTEEGISRWQRAQAALQITASALLMPLGPAEYSTRYSTVRIDSTTGRILADMNDPDGKAKDDQRLSISSQILVAPK